jgi:hypothetical protein
LEFSSSRGGDGGIENSAKLTALVLKIAELLARQKACDDYEFEPAFGLDHLLQGNIDLMRKVGSAFRAATDNKH